MLIICHEFIFSIVPFLLLDFTLKVKVVNVRVLEKAIMQKEQKLLFLLQGQDTQVKIKIR